MSIKSLNKHIKFTNFKIKKGIQDFTFRIYNNAVIIYENNIEFDFCFKSYNKIKSVDTLMKFKNNKILFYLHTDITKEVSKFSNFEEFLKYIMISKIVGI